MMLLIWVIFFVLDLAKELVARRGTKSAPQWVAQAQI